MPSSPDHSSRHTNPRPVLQVHQLHWSPTGSKRGKGLSQWILEDINFSVSRGEFIGVIGPNGAGKSSLLRTLYKVNTPTRGRIDFLGQDLSRISQRALARKMAVVIQESVGDFELSVFQLVRMGLAPHKTLFARDTAADKQAIEQAIVAVELADKRDTSIDRLSGGEKQRAMIARAIVQHPELLVMDEPTNHLDVRHRLEVLQLATRMNATVIASIHDLNLAAAFCDRLLLLNHGRVLDFGPPEQVLNEAQISAVFDIDAIIDQHPYHDGPRITFGLSPDETARDRADHGG